MSTALTSKENDCRSCYKCIRVCPTKSISFLNDHASIIPEECILCGACYLACPQNCKIIRDDTAVAQTLLASHGEVYASLAPSFLAAFPGSSFADLKAALLALGFTDVEETAVGATIVKRGYDALVKSHKRDIVISTSCHALNLLIEKHYPEAAKYLAPVLSPMLAHGQDLKRRHPGAKVIFLGPCIAKKNEIEMYPDYVDCVLTFLELKQLFEARKIVLQQSQEAPKKESKARLFPLEGGILKTMDADDPEYTYLAVSGTENCIAAIKDILSGKVHRTFIEMSACAGSCINGPALGAPRAPVSAALLIAHAAGQADFPVSAYSSEAIKKRLPAYSHPSKQPSEEEIKAILASIGKTTKKDELNCSSCGYPSCREKAIAVYEGKASLTMCLPFLMEKAKSFSNAIVSESDSAILVTDENFVIQLANPACSRLFKTSDSLVGASLDHYMETTLFSLALGGENAKSEKLYLARYDAYLEVNVTYDPQFHIVIGIFRDVTSLTKERAKEKEAALKTSKITSEVIEKNMRAVQEIASLLGQSAAETKVALSTLEKALNTEAKDKHE
jgi:iron only hydrogenase large subunit-like protein